MTHELIGEVSSNHGGDLELAKAFIWQFKAAGADWIKFQSYQTKHLRRGDPQAEWLAQAELTDDAHFILKAECEKAGVGFLTTVFTADRVPFLVDTLGLKTLKVGSGESGNAPLCDALRLWPEVRVIASASVGKGPVTRWDWLGCVSRYPVPAWLVAEPGLWDWLIGTVGWSDHCVGLEGCERAIIRDKRIIEKHVCLPEQKRPMRPWEASIEEFTRLRQFADAGPKQYEGRWQHHL
jgi:N,N'-diacetyllegionaminate synthase